jgi:membrane-bound metal-dependent hydrolase YbcI (DUF457 family)
MWAVGHLALGYLTGKTTSKLLGVSVNIPLLLFVSILPDFDMLTPFLIHRGPTHSLVVYALISIPFFVLFGKKTIIYFVALSQHALLGDFLANGGMSGVQLLWPISATWYTTPFYITTLTLVYFEWILFLLSTALIVKMGDLQKLFKPHPFNLVLTVPIVTIILPVSLGIPISVPIGLVIPHLVYLVLLAISIVIDFKAILMKKTR